MINNIEKLKVALVSESLTQLGGAENVLMAISEMFPDAPIYTPIYDKQKMDKYFGTHKIITSSLQKIPYILKLHRLFFNLLPNAFESFDLGDYDLIISNVSAFAKGVIVPQNTIHISYIHTPTRYIWSDYFSYIHDNVPEIFRHCVKKMALNLRLWDYCAAQRPDILLGNSHYICHRIMKYYKREAKTLYPFCDTEKFVYNKSASQKEYYLMTGRLVSYKRFDITIKAFNKMPDKKLIIAGSGIYAKELKKMITGKNISMLGRVDDDDYVKLYQEAKGYIFTAKEDFGITPLEAMSCGTPVIAYKDGGVIETVKEYETGIFFDMQTPESLIEAINKFETMKFSQKSMSQHVDNNFSKDKFQNNLNNFIKEALL